MKFLNALILTIAFSILLVTILACKDDFGVGTKTIIIRTRRRCKKTRQASTKLENDVKTVRNIGKKLKRALKRLVADYKSGIQTKSGHGQD